ncbi:hypothetical protein KJ359_003990 [Pestalotiopsis sp. 9143b]|nr:hypothetical protein KJ359_003990 [Pestalotiopsis sp. 9143b]
MAGERAVRFDDRPSRTSPRSRDSGLGSSTDQSYAGGRSDRFFTAQDYDTQRFNVGALQEALDSCREEKGKYKKRVSELDAEVSMYRKTTREQETEIRTLRDENTTLRHQRDKYQNEAYDLRRRLAPSSESDYMMSGGSGHSSNGLSRSGSRRQENQEQKERLLERMNTVNPPPEPAAKDPARKQRRSSMSQKRSSFIQELQADERAARGSGPPVTTRGFDRIDTSNYTTSSAGMSSPISSRAEASMSPRSSTVSYNTYNTTTTSGDYVPERLPPKPRVESNSSSSRKHRSR